ncbi:MAG: class I SAM-dependent methyltransferase [Myxococcota bacterium]|nr:class I SAM-dependent methyltransferase [Myxococcota bacterium]
MRSTFWDAMHANFEGAVFDPVGSDVQRAYARAVRRFAGDASFACDYGCGTGRQLPALAKRFERVLGIDFAPKLLDVASERCAALDNVELRRVDLRKPIPNLRNVGFGVCVNAWIMPNHDDRALALRHIRNSLARGAALVFVIPSLEGALFVNNRLIEWNRRTGLRGRALLREGIAATSEAARDGLHGVIDLDGSRTKHFLREEARVTFEEAGFDVLHEDRVEYPWDAYFEDPPRWLTGTPERKEPAPWDWLFVLRKR